MKQTPAESEPLPALVKEAATTAAAAGETTERRTAPVTRAGNFYDFQGSHLDIDSRVEVQGGVLGDTAEINAWYLYLRPLLFELAYSQDYFHRHAIKTLPSEEHQCWGFMFCSCHIEILNNFIFDTVFPCQVR